MSTLTATSTSTNTKSRITSCKELEWGGTINKIVRVGVVAVDTRDNPTVYVSQRTCTCNSMNVHTYMCAVMLEVDQSRVHEKHTCTPFVLCAGKVIGE